MTNNANSESVNITENAEPVNTGEASVDSAAVQLGDEVCFNITEEGTVIIGKPVAGVGQAIEADAQQKYVFNMSSDEITSATTEGDDLVVTFDNGSTVTLENYSREFADGGDTLNFINGEVITLASLIEEQPAEEELEEPQVELREALVETDQTPEEVVQELAQTEPAAGEESVADILADIEPAAGDAGAGAAGNSGYGFESSFNPQGIISIEDVGPLDPTALQYGINQPTDDLFIEAIAEDPPLNPSLEFDNVQVLEDGSVQLLLEVAPDSPNGIYTITITGIPSTWGVTGDGTFDPGTGTWTHTPPAGVPYSGGPILSPPADSDVDLNDLVVTVSESEPDTGNTGTSTGTVDVIVDAVADAPDVDGLNDTGLEGETLQMDIPVALTGEEVNAGGENQGDGSESITNIIIEVVQPAPPAAQIDLSDFVITNVNGVVTPDANGNIVLGSRAELDTLEITPAAGNTDFVGTIDFKVTLNTQENPSDIDFNDTNDTNQATDTFSVTWKPVANPPEVEVDPRDVNPNGDVENGYVYEDNSVVMDVSGTLDPNGSGDEILTLTVTGIDLTKLDGFSASNGPDGEVWGRVAGSTDDNASFTITLNNGGANYTGTFTFTPDAQSDLDITGMEVVASAYEPATDTTADSAPDAFDVYVDAVADDLDLQVTDSSGNENTTLDIQISNVFTGEELIDQAGGDTNDGSEEIINIVLSSTADLQNDFTVTNDNNNVTFDSNGNIVFTDKSDLNGLKITPNDTNYSGTVSIDVTLNTAETELNGVDFDDTNNTATDTETVNLTWKPVVNPPTITVNNGVDDAQVKEDFSVDVPVFAELGANASATETLTIRIDGINLERLEGGEAGFSATGQDGAVWTRVDDGSDDSNASYQLELPAGVTEYNGTLTFDPVDQSDLDITGMTATATATDTVTTSTGTEEISSTASDDFNVIVDAVADKPDVEAADNSGEEGDALAVDINGMLGDDQDGSESITGYEVRGDQAEMNGFTFTVNGVERAPVNGVISLSVAEVDALVVTPKDSTWTGDLNLEAYVLNAEDATEQDAGEFDGSDNTNFDNDPFTLTWVDDDEPFITQPNEVTVDETDFVGSPRETSDTGEINVEFGDDYNGATITGNGQFNIGSATSNGDAITVTFDSATNTYTGKAGTGAEARDVFTLTIGGADTDTDGSASSDYTFTLLDTIDHPVDGDNSNGEHNDELEFTFGFTATDSDGDVANSTITVNVLDDGPSANNDVNSFQADNVQKDFNIVMVLDVSGSMAGDKLELLKSSVANLLQDYNDYNGGQVKVHFVPFASSDQTSATFSVTSDAELNAAIDYINGMNAAGNTNYEAPMQSAIDWLQGNSADAPIVGADTYTYFISDGEPNRYINQSGNVTSGSAGQVMNEINGSDGSNEIALLKSLSKVVGVGIGVNSTTLARLDQISNDPALDVQDANDLYQTLSNNNPVRGSVDGNVITGENGGAGAADDLSADQDTTVTQIGFGANTETIAANGSATIDGAYGKLTINSDGSYTYTLLTGATSADVLQEVFDYVITDGDGDTSLANLTINITIPDDQPANLQTDAVIVDESDFATGTADQDSATGKVTADFGTDGPGTFEVGSADDVTFNGAKDGVLTSNGEPIVITTVGNSYVGTAAGETIFTLDLNETTGNYDFTLTGQMDHADASNPNDVINLAFDVIGKDSDGDTLGGKINVKVFDDAPVAHDDINSYQVQQSQKDFNIVMILDISGSMEGSKLALLKSSVANLLQDYNDYNGGNVKVHIVPFATSDSPSATFNVTSDAELDAAVNYVNGMNANGFTNYEAPMQSAIDWLQGNSSNDPISGADTYAYFVSDGEPNRFMNQSGNIATGNAGQVMDEIDGTRDGSDEIALLQSLTTEVVGVGIGVNSTTLGRLSEIGDGPALDVQDANDLYQSLSNINPVKGSADGNVITGENGGSGAADVLSQDADTLVTDVDGNAVNVGSATVVQGTYGTLTINANGDYSYSLRSDVNVGSSRSVTLDPSSATVVGSNATATQNGITITGYDKHGNLSDLTWLDTSVGDGIGVQGTGDKKVYPYGESLEIGFDAANSVEISISELGSNDNTGKGIDYIVHFADGSEQAGEYGFVQSQIVNGVTSFTLSSSDYGDKLIEGVTITSVDTAHDQFGAASFLLNDVTVNYQDNVDIVDTFTYTITDADGDTSTASLTLYGDQKGTTAGNDTLYGNDGDNFLYGGAGDDVIYGEAGNDVIVGGAGDDTLTGGEGADTFLFTNNGGEDTITDFDASEGDVLDISDVLTGFDALSDSLEDFVFTSSNGGNTEVYVDAAGGGDQAAATLIVTLEGVDVTLANLNVDGSGNIM